MRKRKTIGWHCFASDRRKANQGICLAYHQRLCRCISSLAPRVYIINAPALHITNGFAVVYHHSPRECISSRRQPCISPTALPLYIIARTASAYHQGASLAYLLRKRRKRIPPCGILRHSSCRPTNSKYLPDSKRHITSCGNVICSAGSSVTNQAFIRIFCPQNFT